MVDQSAVGLRFTPVTAAVEPGRLRYFFETLGENNSLYRDPAAAKAAGYKGIPIPPTYLFCLEMLDNEKPFEFLTALDIDLGKVLHGEQSFAYHAPVVVGDTLTFQSSVASVADKKGGAMTLIVVETAVTNQDGVHVADTARTIVVRNG
ncbi:MaoC family dehydratase N-terminal domain-containing protein [Rhodopseudomonas telluris]|uniref:MaoC family dehydratase N-terminal domain-containing protein n=1 Tax=Rhodopseudomonas telluris TaxID=644215 RepID=A0ABV6EU58_9BRAD